MQVITGSAPDSRLSLFSLEAGLTVTCCALAFLASNSEPKWLARLESRLASVARRRMLSVLGIALSTLILRLAMLPLLPPPQPFVHDEFSHLLAADTFASGRLTNPTPPMWIHMESFHIDMKPTYMSMYFPGQGLFLAAGQVLFGQPWFGILLSSAILCGAICWMLQGWLPPRWALLGGFLAMLRLGLFSYWVNSYYGGAVAAIGGALVLGAVPRFLRKPGAGSGIAMAVGAIILAISRPFEGCAVCLGACLVIWLRWRKSPGPALRALRFPALLLLAAAGLFGYYNFRVFGSALTLPYTLNRAEYALAPIFVWQKPRPEPHYNHAVLRDFFVNEEIREFNKARGISGFLGSLLRKLGVGLVFFVGAALFPLLLMIRRALRDKRLRDLGLIGVVFGAALAVNAWIFPHYFAPFTAGIYAILLQSLRHLRHWKTGGRAYGLAMGRLAPVLCVVFAGMRLFAGPDTFPVNRFPLMWYGSPPLGLPRAKVLQDLTRLPGPQLAIVRYSPNHSSIDEWVYNAADVDRAKVVWIREMDPTANEEALRYFRGRTAWLVEPDKNPPGVSPWK